MRHRFWQVSRTQPRAELCASLLALLHTPRKLAPTKQAVPNSKPLMAELGCKSPCLTWQTSLRPNKCKLCSKDLASRSKLQPFQDMSLGSPRFFVGIVTRSLAHSKVCTTWRHSIALFGLKLREGTPTAFFPIQPSESKSNQVRFGQLLQGTLGKNKGYDWQASPDLQWPARLGIITFDKLIH